MATEPSHEECVELLDNPSTQNMLEKFGYEYSDRGLANWRKQRPEIIPILVKAIVRELEACPVFPPRYRDHSPQIGVFIHRQAGDFVLTDIEKPSIVDEYAFATPEGAARGYIRKVVEPYWLQSSSENSLLPKSTRRSW